MLKKVSLVLFMVGLLSIGSFAVLAQQGGGNGPGGNPDAPGRNPQQGNCINDGDAQGSAFRGGGIGFIDTENGGRWDNCQRDTMGRGTGQGGVGFYAALPPATEGELAQEIVDLMIQGWLDEQHAYAAYGAIIAQFGEINPFVNIQQAEAQHIAAWEFLFDRYDIEVPEIPEYEFDEFASATDACTLAVEAEIANFGLYDTMLETFEVYPDLYQVTLALRNASEFNHLPAFENCAG